ncbi:hypothetical protein, partial [Pseudomonas coronafaciens]|uniref:hypothetical protein n=1 Tax=Pseudomonas coronafaciens TaxID=53409 RepID=UPI001C7F34AA
RVLRFRPHIGSDRSLRSNYCLIQKTQSFWIVVELLRQKLQIDRQGGQIIAEGNCDINGAIFHKPRTYLESP